IRGRLVSFCLSKPCVSCAAKPASARCRMQGLPWRMVRADWPFQLLPLWCLLVTDKISYSDLGAADPTTEPFWQACAEGRLTVQRCTGCGSHQFYPRPFCLSCEA